MKASKTEMFARELIEAREQRRRMNVAVEDGVKFMGGVMRALNGIEKELEEQNDVNSRHVEANLDFYRHIFERDLEHAKLQAKTFEQTCALDERDHVALRNVFSAVADLVGPIRANPDDHESFARELKTNIEQLAAAFYELQRVAPDLARAERGPVRTPGVRTSLSKFVSPALFETIATAMQMMSQSSPDKNAAQQVQDSELGKPPKGFPTG